jgi:hypothetical protein
VLCVVAPAIAISVVLNIEYVAREAQGGIALTLSQRRQYRSLDPALALTHLSVTLRRMVCIFVTLIGGSYSPPARVPLPLQP